MKPNEVGSDGGSGGEGGCGGGDGDEGGGGGSSRCTGCGEGGTAALHAGCTKLPTRTPPPRSDEPASGLCDAWLELRASHPVRTLPHRLDACTKLPPG